MFVALKLLELLHLKCMKYITKLGFIMYILETGFDHNLANRRVFIIRFQICFYYLEVSLLK